LGGVYGAGTATLGRGALAALVLCGVARSNGCRERATSARALGHAHPSETSGCVAPTGDRATQLCGEISKIDWAGVDSGAGRASSEAEGGLGRSDLTSEQRI
jgi:hypothetical protein